MPRPSPAPAAFCVFALDVFPSSLTSRGCAVSHFSSAGQASISPCLVLTSGAPRPPQLSSFPPWPDASTRFRWPAVSRRRGCVRSASDSVRLQHSARRRLFSKPLCPFLLQDLGRHAEAETPESTAAAPAFSLMRSHPHSQLSSAFCQEHLTHTRLR